jgi:hypothetical protein
MNQTAQTITPASALDDDALIAAPDARSEWWGGISEATEWRWTQQLEGFPKVIRIHRRKYYRVGDLREFSRTRRAA